MSMECQVNVKSQSELDIGGRETCFGMRYFAIWMSNRGHPVICIVFFTKEFHLIFSSIITTLLPCTIPHLLVAFSLFMY